MNAFSCFLSAAERDLVLILDTARFKYPPHWVPLPLLFEAMAPPDPDTGKPRGELRSNITKQNKPDQTRPNQTKPHPLRAGYIRVWKAPVESLIFTLGVQQSGWRTGYQFVTEGIPAELARIDASPSDADADVWGEGDAEADEERARRAAETVLSRLLRGIPEEGLGLVAVRAHTHAHAHVHGEDEAGVGAGPEGAAPVGDACLEVACGEGRHAESETGCETEGGSCLPTNQRAFLLEVTETESETGCATEGGSVYLLISLSPIVDCA